MFHYRPALLNNSSRMLIASLLAIAIHIGLMNFGFDPKPVHVPSVSLPRSVSVFLGQSHVVKASVVQPEKAQPAAETAAAKPVLTKVQAAKEKTDNPLQLPALSEKKITQPAGQKIMPAEQRTEYSTKDLLPDQGAAPKAGESATPAESHAAQEDVGAALPGILQLAYPRYQLNTPPAYPGLARKRGQEGTVTLRVLVDDKGRVDDVEIESSSGFGLLDRAALTAVRKWSFEPGRRGVEMRPMWVKVPVTFKLTK